MKELKARMLGQTMNEYGCDTKIYLESEVYKVIAHHKYKRCLANAEACMHKRWRPDEGFDYARSTRHMNKWLEIAEKFKEAN